jgi:uncharacterized protein with PQ loop repeat
MDQHLRLAMAYLGSALGVAMVAPQILRIVRHPHLPGVSVWRWSITVVACSLWLTYGVRSGSMPQIPGNVLLISGRAIVLLVPADLGTRRRALALAAVTTGPGRLEPGSPAAGGLPGLRHRLTGMWPQVYETVWRRRGLGPSLSLTSTGLGLVSQLLWLTFAVLTLDIPVVVAAVVAISTNTVITLVEASRRRTPFGSTPLEADLVPEPACA